MCFPNLRIVLSLVPLALLALLTGCGREKDEKARNTLHEAGFDYSVDDEIAEGLKKVGLDESPNTRITDLGVGKPDRLSK